MAGKPKVLVFMLAYNAAQTIESVFPRIPKDLGIYDTNVLVIDDASSDATMERALNFQANNAFPFPLTILRNSVNQGYGGNVKLGMRYAIKNGFDVIALIHGDGQYPPEKIPELIKPIIEDQADIVFGSRMMEGFNALKGGMPLYKFVGNKVLTWIENMMLGSNLTEFHTGLRLYSVDNMKRIPFHLNSNDFHFDTEIIIQLMLANLRIKEFPIPTFYGDEISHVNGLLYAWRVAQQVFFARAQRWSLCYQKKYDLTTRGYETNFQIPKTTFTEAHRVAVVAAPKGSRVLDFGSANGLVGEALKKKGCEVTGIDLASPEDSNRLDKFVPSVIDADIFPVDPADYDIVMLLDVLGHLNQPELFMERLHQGISRRMDTKVMVTSGNIGFIFNRIQLLFGVFNYGKRGILDTSHTRLFTFSSLKRLLEESGFVVEDEKTIPVPFELALGENFLSKTLAAINQILIRVSRGLFGYRIFIIASPRPTLEYILESARGENKPPSQKKGPRARKPS